MSLFNSSIPNFKLGEFTRGLTMPFKAVKYLFAHRGLKRYAALPLLLNVVLYVLALWVAFDYLWSWQPGEVTWRFWGPIGDWLSHSVNWMSWLVKIMVSMLVLGVAFFTFTGIGMVIASPLNDILSEKVELVYCGQESRLSMPLRFTMKSAALSVYDSIHTLGNYLLLSLVALPFLLVPFVGIVPWFLVGAYFGGFGYLDSAMARNYLRPPHKKLLTSKHFWNVLGFGIAMQALFAIPFVGLLLMPVGVTAGTMIYCGEDWEKLLADGGLEKPEGFQPPVCA